MADAGNSRTFDPICGMWLETGQIAATYDFCGRRYGFCCMECQGLFAREPEAHLIRLAHEPDQAVGHRCPYQRSNHGVQEL